MSYNNEAGEFEPNRLPENVKQEVRALSGLAAGLAGGAVGSANGGGGSNAVDVLADAQVGGVVGQNAVVNNYLLESDWSDYHRKIRACGDNRKCIDDTREWLTRRSAWRNSILDNICQSDISKCRELHIDATRSTRLTSVHMSIGRGSFLGSSQNIRNSRFTIPPSYDPRRPDFNALAYHDRVAKNIHPSSYLISRENLSTLNQLAKNPVVQAEYRNNARFRAEFKSEAESAMKESFGNNEMWLRMSLGYMDLKV